MAVTSRCTIRSQYLEPPLQGLRLAAGEYRPMTPDEDGALSSNALATRLRLIDGHLRLFDARTGAPLTSPAERARAEARWEAERRIAELEALLRERGEA